MTTDIDKLAGLEKADGTGAKHPQLWTKCPANSDHHKPLGSRGSRRFACLTWEEGSNKATEHPSCQGRGYTVKRDLETLLGIAQTIGWVEFRDGEVIIKSRTRRKWYLGEDLAAALVQAEERE